MLQEVSDKDISCLFIDIYRSFPIDRERICCKDFKNLSDDLQG